MNEVLDETDKKIIKILQGDPQVSNKTVASLAGITEATAATRIEALVRTGRIRFTLQKDLESWGYRALFIAFLHVDGGTLEDVAHELRRFPEIISIGLLLGSPQITIMGSSTEHSTIKDLLKALFRTKQLREIEIVTSLHVHKFSAQIGDLSALSATIPEPHLLIRELDKIDHAIFSRLQEDGRKSNRAIARELHCSESMVRKRLRRSEEKGFIRFGITVDPTTLGRFSKAWLRIAAHPARIASITKALSDHPDTTMVALVTGTYNILVYLLAESREAIYKTVDNAILTLQGVLSVQIREISRNVLDRHELRVLLRDE